MPLLIAAAGARRAAGTRRRGHRRRPAAHLQPGQGLRTQVAPAQPAAQW